MYPPDTFLIIASTKCSEGPDTVKALLTILVNENQDPQAGRGKCEWRVSTALPAEPGIRGAAQPCELSGGGGAGDVRDEKRGAAFNRPDNRREALADAGNIDLPLK